MKRIYLVALTLTFTTGLVACNDPAEGKAKAKVEAPATPAEPAAADAAPAATEVPEGAIAFDQSAGKIAWTGSKVTGKHDGGFEKFSGWIKHDAAAGTYSFKVTIDMASVQSDSGKLTGHLQSDDFFQVAKHPTAVFETTEPVAVKDGKAEIVGNLTLRGVTKKITFPATVAVAEDGFELSSEFSIKRFDFGVAYKGMADDLIRDEVVIRLDFDGKL